ncbi:MAG: ferric reductase-like transmembrane domain-containing protein, partial [Gemmatimonadales bacterium]
GRVRSCFPKFASTTRRRFVGGMPVTLRATRGRVLRHVVLAAASVVVTVALIGVLHRRDLRERASIATAYVALALLAVTLALGPLNRLRGRPNPVSFNLRRDFGIWSAVMGLAHTAIGLTVHMRGRMYLYFVPEPGHPGIAGLRADPFGAANDTGLIAAVLLLLLASISSDLALRRLGTRRWRSIQRWAYGILALTIAHAVIYQWIEKQRLPLVLLLVALSVTTIALQLMGRRRHG